MKRTYYYLNDDAESPPEAPVIDLDSSDEEVERYLEAMRTDFRAAWADYIQDFD